MLPDDPTPGAALDEAARLIQEGLTPLELTPGQREALLRRVLERAGGVPPLAPAPPPKTN